MPTNPFDAYKGLQQGLSDDDLNYWSTRLVVPNQTKFDAWKATAMDTIKYDTSIPALTNLVATSFSDPNSVEGKVLTADEANSLFDIPAEAQYADDETPTALEASLRSTRANDARILALKQREAELGTFGRLSSSFVGGAADPLVMAGSAAFRAGFAPAATFLGTRYNVAGLAALGNYAAHGAKSANWSRKAALAYEAFETAGIAAVVDEPTFMVREQLYGEDVTVPERILTYVAGTAAGYLAATIGRSLQKQGSSISKALADKIIQDTALDVDGTVTLTTKWDRALGHIAEYSTDAEVMAAARQKYSVSPTAYQQPSDLRYFLSDVNTMYNADVRYATRTPIDPETARAFISYSGTDILPEQALHIGRNYGRAMYASIEPSVAEGKLLGQTTGTVVAIDIPENRILDIDLRDIPVRDAKGNWTQKTLHDFQFIFDNVLGDKLGGLKNNLLEQPTVAKMLHKLRAILESPQGRRRYPDADPDEMIDSIVHGIAREANVDAFRFKDIDFANLGAFGEEGAETLAVFNHSGKYMEAFEVDPVEIHTKYYNKVTADAQGAPDIKKYYDQMDSPEYASNISMRPTTEFHEDITEHMKTLFEKDVAGVTPTAKGIEPAETKPLEFTPEEKSIVDDFAETREKLEAEIELDPEAEKAVQYKEILDMNLDEQGDVAVKQGIACLRRG